MKRLFSILAAVVFLSATLTASAAGNRAPSSTDPPIISWQPPATYSMTPASGRTSLAEIGAGPVTLFPITPCRQYDSRNTTPLPDNTPRTVTLTGAPCGIPASTNAIALNITVFNIAGAGSNGVFKVGTVAPPTTAWINYPPSETQRANAGVVATNGNAIVVQVNQGAGSVDFVVDVFGYYYNGNSYMMPTGNFFSIWGDYSGGGVLFGRNDQATAADSFGARGWAFSTGAGSAGVEGEGRGATGAVFGVKGVTSSASAGAAGVYGTEPSGAASGSSNLAAGVIGSSATRIGVEGISDNAGVRGEIYNGAGVFVALGILGLHSGANYYGVWATGDYGGTGAKYFVEPHPTDASRVIRYIALEGPESGTYFRGTARTVGGHAVIEVPESFRMVSTEEDLTVQLTPVGTLTTMAVMSQNLDQIVVRSSRDATFHYLVQGVRRSFKGFEPIVSGGEFAPWAPSDTMPASLPEEVKRRLVANGTYNPDGTVNMSTAERMGWAQKWRDDEAKAKAKQEAAKADTN